MPRKVVNINTNDMYLVYRDIEGNHHFQHWEDVTSCGTLIDPETGEDMELIGWVIGED